MDQYYENLRKSIEKLIASIDAQRQTQAYSESNFYLGNWGYIAAQSLDYLDFEHNYLKDFSGLLLPIKALKAKLEEEKPIFTFYSDEAKGKESLILENIRKLDELMQSIEAISKELALQRQLNPGEFEFWNDAFHINLMEHIRKLGDDYQAIHQNNNNIFDEPDLVKEYQVFEGSKRGVQDLFDRFRSEKLKLQYFLLEVQRYGPMSNSVLPSKHPAVIDAEETDTKPKIVEKFTPLVSLYDRIMKAKEKPKRHQLIIDYVGRYAQKPKKIEKLASSLRANNEDLYFLARIMEKLGAQKQHQNYDYFKIYFSLAKWGHLPSIYHIVNAALAGAFEPRSESIQWALNTLRLLNKYEQLLLSSIDDLDSQLTIRRLVKHFKSIPQTLKFGLDLNQIPDDPKGFNTFYLRYTQAINSLPVKSKVTFKLERDFVESALQTRINRLEHNARAEEPCKSEQRVKLKSKLELKTLGLLDKLIQTLGESRIFSYGQLDKKLELEEIRKNLKNTFVEDEKIPSVLESIRNVCAKKRNYFGLFQPRSLEQFNRLIKELGMEEQVSTQQKKP